ncbi:hypothetical protein SESBI_50948, partial [Sesbania bispinosa]
IYYLPNFSGNAGRGYNRGWHCIKEFVLYTWNYGFLELVIMQTAQASATDEVHEISHQVGIS